MFTAFIKFVNIAEARSTRYCFKTLVSHFQTLGPRVERQTVFHAYNNIFV